MKTYLTIFIILLISSFVRGQDETPISKSHELGLNVNAILNQFVFKRSDDILQPVPANQFPILMYRVHSPRTALRLGVGFYNNSERDTTITGFSDTKNFQSFRNFSMFIGFQKSYLTKKKANFYIGLDLKYDVEIGRFDQDVLFTSFDPSRFINKSTRTTHSAGFGLPIGIVFHFSKRLNISTEGSLDLLANLRIDKSENISVGNNNESKTETRFIKLNLKQPLSLFINYRF